MKAVSATINVRAEPSAGNATPVFPSVGSNARSVDENSPPGTNVGKPVKANDTGGDRLHYTLSGAGEGSFDINPATGQITVAARVALDADTTASYTVTVTATDPFGAEATPSGQATQSVTITINDLNEAPAITGGVTRASVDENTAIATAVSTYTATDVDQTAEVEWSVSGTDAGDFEISDAGALTFKKDPPDFEKPVDSNGDNVYMVAVVATDAGVDDKNKMTAERAVIVTVKNVEEDGTVTLTSVQPKIGFPLTASVTDLDGGVMGTTWKWERDGGTAESPTGECANTSGWEAAEEDMGAKTATYTPDAKDEGKCLRATAMYTDGKGMDDAMGESVNAVVKDETNGPPRFRAGGVDSDAGTAANTGDTAMSAKRSIFENVAPEEGEPRQRGYTGRGR